MGVLRPFFGVGVGAMSVQAISWAYKVAGIDDPIEAFLLVTLGNYSDEFGVCWPSQVTLREDCRCSERKVRDCLISLEERGLIRRVLRRRANGSRRSDVIVLIGFDGRKPLRSPSDHPALERLNLVEDDLFGPINRRIVPDAATGTTCRTNRHHVPDQPAPRAALEPSIEPSIEPYPPTPHGGRVNSQENLFNEKEGSPHYRKRAQRREAVRGFSRSDLERALALIRQRESDREGGVPAKGAGGDDADSGRVVPFPGTGRH